MLSNFNSLLYLTKAYTDRRRRFHNLGHIQDMLTNSDSLDLRDHKIMAIWWHDAVYIPGREDNEIKSALLAAEYLAREGVDTYTISLVTQTILDTKDHVATNTESELVLDLDLRVLGLESYYQYLDIYVNRVREEFSYLTDSSWCLGRTEFIKRMLGRPYIYYTKEFRDRYEVNARNNLSKELASWKLGLGIEG
jgi:predicted metal-dependent HD superfamily phosphohydrolase